MLVEYVLFAVYLLVFGWLVTRVRFFRATGLNAAQITSLFLIRVITSIIYGWIAISLGGPAGMGDSWTFNLFALDEYHTLGNDPWGFFTNIFRSNYAHGYAGFFGSSDSYWNDLKLNAFVKLLSIFDIFSFGNYFINVIFFSFLTFFAPMGIYRVMKDVYPNRSRLLMIACFFAPSYLYWCSGIHKEGLIALAVSMIIYHMYFAIKQKKFSVVRIAGIIGGLFILLIFRNFMLVIIAPALLAWFITFIFPKFRLSAFVAVYLLAAILFFSLRFWDGHLDFPQAVVNKQKAFVQVIGNTSIPIKQLKANPGSFIINTPQAIKLAAFRPYPNDIKNFSLLACSLEIALILTLFLVFLFFMNKEKALDSSVIYFGLFFSFSLLLAIGFSVNNIGAIVRYRSIIFPFLLAPMLVRTDWKKIKGLFMKTRPSFDEKIISGQ